MTGKKLRASSAAGKAIAYYMGGGGATADFEGGMSTLNWDRFPGAGLDIMHLDPLRVVVSAWAYAKCDDDLAAFGRAADISRASGEEPLLEVFEDGCVMGARVVAGRLSWPEMVDTIDDWMEAFYGMLEEAGWEP